MKPLKVFLLVATSIFLFGCAGGPIKTATKFTSYEDFQPGPDGGVDLVWARIGLRDAQRLKSKLDDYDSVVIDREAGNKDFSTMIDSLDDAKDAINYWVERLGDTLQNIDDA
ncbi:hypothetical protein AB4166_03460 [Vibrio splendidus]|uniref:hypothetical protein n=1 Tax=Vibrio TaxID=662 RepID=UPI000C8400AB|nr:MULTISPECIES: hypothetical protein [Vibrio]MBO7911260.1 hypothetical protein [Vibrio sp. G41H]MCF7490095.1 hypothetical protein [Vibrio sp. G-C-1]MCW4445923.1 hypothetical protein [Vibrio splendidus]PMO50022.1 hypothetical protein BCT09_01710 [Vibrio splendidus]PTO63112.1 hypothetical protein CWN99_15980 [Vibrio splendidus]